MQTVNVITMPVYSLNFATCGHIIERRLRALPGVMRVDASYVSQTRIFAEVLPADKAHYVQELQAGVQFTAMVGDGVNAAPALAQADLGIAIGAGTGGAIETAEIVLMRSDPLDVLAAIRLSKATVRKMKEHLFWAAIYNVIAIPIAGGILYPIGILFDPAIAALAMSASSITVATNAVLLKRVEPDSRAVTEEVHPTAADAGIGVCAVA